MQLQYRIGRFRKKSAFDCIKDLEGPLIGKYLTPTDACARLAVLGAARSARMVGWAMNNSHNQKEEVPAHRVVNRKGLLTGKHHFNGTNLMQQLLENEGIVVIENQIQNLEDIFWNPKDAFASKKKDL